MLNDRIILNNSFSAIHSPVLEMAMLGHCPGKVNITALTDKMRSLMRQSGYDLAIDFLESEDQNHTRFDELNKQHINNLYHLPVPLSNIREFKDLFPEAEKKDTLFQSKLAGSRAWLPAAVADFFNTGAVRLWVVRIPEQQWQNGFLPRIKTSIHDSCGLRGLASLFPLNSIGIFALPDLERIQLPANLDSHARKRLQNPAPQFLPCNSNIMDDHRERRYSSEIPVNYTSWPLDKLLKPIIHHLQKYRPDLMCLFTPSLEQETADTQAQIAEQDIEHIRQIRNNFAESSWLRRIQFLFPYLKGNDYLLKSISGCIGGMQCINASKQGIWRSIAGLPVTIDGSPYPSIAASEVQNLRHNPGLSVLYDKGQFITLDDEQLTVPSIISEQQSRTRQAADEPHRSAEISRFMGFLLRELKKLGESLIFNSDANDPAPRMLLEAFFKQLYQLGALRGNNESEAFQINRQAPQNQSGNNNSIEYQIFIRPSYPVDSIQLTLIQNQNYWQVSSNG